MAARGYRLSRDLWASCDWFRHEESGRCVIGWGQRRGEEEMNRVATGRNTYACRSSVRYNVIVCKVMSYKCSRCDEALASSCGEITVSMQYRNILENRCTYRMYDKTM